MLLPSESGPKRRFVNNQKLAEPFLPIGDVVLVERPIEDLVKVLPGSLGKPDFLAATSSSMPDAARETAATKAACASSNDVSGVVKPFLRCHEQLQVPMPIGLLR